MKIAAQRPAPRLLAWACAVGLLGALAGHASAQTFGGGAGFSIPDNNAAGGSSTIAVSSTDVIASFNSVTIFGFTHTWVGDLVATLSNGTTTVDLLDRVGRTASTGFGSSGDLGGTYTFSMSGSPFPTSGNVAPGTYQPFPNGTGGEMSPFNGSLASFVGSVLAGSWTLNISDRAGGDVGAITGWEFNVTAVPEPATWGLFGLGVSLLPWVAARRRRARGA